MCGFVIAASFWKKEIRDRIKSLDIRAYNLAFMKPHEIDDTYWRETIDKYHKIEMVLNR